MIFVDSGAWIASFVASDAHHQDAIDWIQNNSELLVTTDYVVSETLTWLRRQSLNHQASKLSCEWVNSGDFALHLIDESDFDKTLEVFRIYSDKDWSFTDCSSKAVIDRLGIKKAFAFDRHFRQFGHIEIVP